MVDPTHFGRLTRRTQKGTSGPPSVAAGTPPLPPGRGPWYAGGVRRYELVKEEIDPKTGANMGLQPFYSTDSLFLARAAAYAWAQVYGDVMIWDWTLKRYVGFYSRARVPGF